MHSTPCDGLTMHIPPTVVPTLSDAGPATKRGWSSAAVVDLVIRLTMLALLGYWVLSIVRPLFGIIVWSGILAVALYPAFDWLAAHLGGRRRLAATTIAILSVLVVLGPVTWIVLSFITSLQAPGDIVAAVHGYGGLVFHDVTTLRHA